MPVPIDVASALKFLLPPDEGATGKALWWWHMKLYVTVVVLVVCTIAAFGVPGFIAGRFALAHDIQKDIKVRVNEAVAPMQVAQAKVEVKVDRATTLLVDSLAKSKAGEIREAKRKYCRTPPNTIERDRAQDEIERLEAEYTNLRGNGYFIPLCVDL